MSENYGMVAGTMSLVLILVLSNALNMDFPIVHAAGTMMGPSWDHAGSKFIALKRNYSKMQKWNVKNEKLIPFVKC